jgi:hypothetical protein
MAPTPSTDGAPADAAAVEPATTTAPALTVGQLVGLPDESGDQLKVGVLTSVDPLRVIRLGVASDYGLTVTPLV